MQLHPCSDTRFAVVDDCAADVFVQHIAVGHLRHAADFLAVQHNGCTGASDVACGDKDVFLVYREAEERALCTFLADFQKRFFPDELLVPADALLARPESG